MDNEKRAIELIEMASEMSERYYKKPIVCTYSGGKDSDVLVELFLRSGVEFEVYNSHTTADAPQTVYHIREKFKQLEEKGIKCTIQKPELSMWQLIPRKKMPPTRLMRYCCSYLKETACPNRMISTGVRWDESYARKGRGPLEIIKAKKQNRIVLQHSDIYEEMEGNRQISLFDEEPGEMMLMNDNSKKRRMIESCILKAKSVCNPIVDWTTNELWDYINSEHIEVNPLYQCGFSRVGCIGCPAAGKKRYFEFAVFPKYKQMYLNAFKRMLDERRKAGKTQKWENEYDVFAWWMEEKDVKGQHSLDDYEYWKGTQHGSDDITGDRPGNIGRKDK